MVATYAVTTHLLNARAAKHRNGVKPKGYASIATYATEADDDSRATLARSTLASSDVDDADADSPLRGGRRFELTPMFSARQEALPSSVESSDVGSSPTHSPLKKSSSDNYAVQRLLLWRPVRARVLLPSRSMTAVEQQSTSFLYVPDSPQRGGGRGADNAAAVAAGADELFDLRSVCTVDDEREQTPPLHAARYPLLAAAGGQHPRGEPPHANNHAAANACGAKRDRKTKKEKRKEKTRGGRAHVRNSSKLMHIVNSKSRNERKASQTLGIIFAVFMVLWCPFFVSYVMEAVCTPCRRHISIDMISAFTWLGYCSSMVNPFIYSMFNRQFRAAFGRIMTCRCREFQEAKMSTTYVTSTYA
ncbi:PREDICTED: 5-hydroxytryptamine receptor 2A-like [Priapulus caudatus]|uniref:5-hydroxytryptamine receptor 2A-like n=1 Tax=Priapulus caudatus TaxID=37621 RepID=A0ABM1ERE9_PRICU|nr:PREDICTED: 5-hydroxytryptamine receptor 2A-like [Priapulus caudatus]